jgi:transcriptional regulator
VLRNPHHVDDDPEVVRELVREFPFATLVSQKDGELVASHYAVMLDEASEEPGSDLVVVMHVGRPDDRYHDLTGEVLLIIHGRHGYVSPSWYAPGAVRAPTWNFSVVHAYGVPEVMDPEENLRVLGRLVEQFEQHVDDPLYLDPDWGRPLARGTVGLRIPITRFQTQLKLSLDKDPTSRQSVIEHLRAPGPYQHPELADDMERARQRRGVV